MRNLPLVLVHAVVLGGCGGDVVVDSERGTGGAGGTGGAPSSSSGASSVANSSSAGTSSSVTVGSATAVVSSVSSGPGSCYDAGSEEECIACVTRQYPEGAQELNDIYTKYCLCGDGAPCAPFCAGTPACEGMVTPECQQCIDGTLSQGHPCIEQSIGECVQMPACNQFLTEVQGCF